MFPFHCIIHCLVSILKEKKSLKAFCCFSVKQRCLAEQKSRKQRATKKISIFIGSFIICFAPYVITR